MRKHFRRNNTGFTCEACGVVVPPHPTSSRDHCHICLVSKHVDAETPGDRASTCGGLMDITALEGSTSTRDGLIITYRCRLCDKTMRNHVAPDDNTEVIIAFLKKPRL